MNSGSQVWYAKYFLDTFKCSSPQKHPPNCNLQPSSKEKMSFLEKDHCLQSIWMLQSLAKEICSSRFQINFRVISFFPQRAMHSMEVPKQSMDKQQLWVKLGALSALNLKKVAIWEGVAYSVMLKSYSGLCILGLHLASQGP